MSDLLTNNVRKRLTELNQNWLSVVTGDTGSGKSYCAMRICKKVDPSFDVSRVFFSIEDLLSAINNGKLKKGQMAVLDEGGVSFAARKWQSAENIEMSFLLQTLRHKNFGLIFCLPRIDFLDVSGRRLIHCMIKTLQIDRKNEECIVSWRNSRWSDYHNKLLFPYPRIKENGRIKVLKRVRIGKPSEKLIRDYERKKSAFTKELTRLAEERLRTRREKALKKQQPKGPTKREFIEKEIAKGKLSTRGIADKFDTHRNYVLDIKRLMARKRAKHNSSN